MNYAEKIVASFDARIAYELAKDETNTSMQKTLADMRKSVAHERIAEVMNTCDVDVDFINRQTRVDRRFNVYAAEKVINVARSLVSVQTLNHYTRHIVKTAFALEANNMTMTRDDAASACSLRVTCKDKTREKFIVKYQKNVDASTVSTQSSSSLNALLMYSILVERKNSANVSEFVLNRDNSACLQMLVDLDCEI